MNLGPLFAYLSLLNGTYGIVVLAIAMCCLIAAMIASRSNEKQFIANVVVGTMTFPVLLVCMGFLFYIMYNSARGVSYDFWPLTLSLFAVLYPTYTVMFLDLERKSNFKNLKTVLLFTFVACMIFSPMVAGFFKLNEKLGFWWFPF